jgi:hypothetical protein
MTQDEIVKMAREAGLVRTGDKWVEPARWGVTELVHFAALVAAAEREAILQMSKDNWFKTQDNYEAAIRARGPTGKQSLTVAPLSAQDTNLYAKETK